MTIYLNLQDLMRSDSNLLIVSQKELGKTTLLHYICFKISSDIASFPNSIPFYIDYAELHSSYRGVQQAMHDCGDGRWSRSQLDNFLSNGQCTLLIDNLSHTDRRKLGFIQAFISRHRNNRFIFIIDQDFYLNLNIDESLFSDISLQKIYMHSFTRRQTRQLVNKWFVNAPVDTDSIADLTIRHIRTMNIPRSPFLISLILWILETQRQFSVMNKASLVESFVYGILERLGDQSSQREELDYRIKEHYLSHVAYIMARDKSKSLSHLELEKTTIEYFESKGFNTSISEFISYFLQKGVLVETNGSISFKFRFFQEYFTAKVLMENSDFLRHCLQESEYLQFSNELDFLTGLQRNNTIIMETLCSYLEKSFKELDLSIELELFERIDLNESPFDDGDIQDISQKLQKNIVKGFEKDDLLDDWDKEIEGINIQKIKEPSYQPLHKFADALSLFSKVIRNCELIDDVDLKASMLEKCIGYWARFSLILLFIVEEEMKDNPPEENKKEIQYFAKIAVPGGVQSQMQDVLGSEKLVNIINSIIHGRQHELVFDLMTVLLYSSLRLPKYFEELSRLIDRSKRNRYALEIIFYFLSGYYMFRKNSQAERKSLEKLIGDIYLIKQKSSMHSIDKDRGRSLYISGLRRKLLQSERHSVDD